MFLHVALEVVDDSSAFLANGVIKSVVAAAVAVLQARAVLNKVADSFQVAFGGSNAKGSVESGFVNVFSDRKWGLGKNRTLIFYEPSIFIDFLVSLSVLNPCCFGYYHRNRKVEVLTD